MTLWLGLPSSGKVTMRAYDARETGVPPACRFYHRPIAMHQHVIYALGPLALDLGMIMIGGLSCAATKAPAAIAGSDL